MTGISPFALPDPLREAAEFDAAESAGLFVGVRAFDDPAILEVPFAVDDAVDLACLFCLELRLITADRTVLALAGEPQKKASREALDALRSAGAKVGPATLAAIYRQAYELGQTSGPRGLFVVSVASHGFADQGAAVLAAADTLRRRRVHTGVSLDALLDDVTQAGAPRRLVLLDACRERFSAQTRSGEAEAASAMGEAFREAIGRARGLAMLAATTFGGYAYDDPKRRNGVFTGAICDGLRGKATADARHLVTLDRLAAYADEQVRRWVKRHRPEHRELSRGVAATFDPDAVRELPLAVDPRGLEAAAAYQRRRHEALALLGQQLEPPLTGALFDEIREALAPELPSSALDELVEEIEALDGSVRMRRALVHFFGERRSELLGESRSGPMDNRRISLSLRQTERNPWEELADSYPVGSIIEGKVRNLTEFGAFVEITDDIDGLIHVSDMSWTKRVKHPSEVLTKGDAVKARITNIDVANQRVSLSIKEFLPNEWDSFADQYQVGDILDGKVVNVTDFGLFIDIYEGLEGLAHISEIDLPSGKLEHLFAVGDWVSARIMRIEEEDKKVGLTMRGVPQPDEAEKAELEAAARAEAAADEGAPSAEAAEEPARW